MYVVRYKGDGLLREKNVKDIRESTVKSIQALLSQFLT